MSLSTNSLSATSISTGRVYQTTLSSGSNDYYAKFTASSSSTYKIYWSGNAYYYSVYEGIGNEVKNSGTDDASYTVSSYSGDVIIKFKSEVRGAVVGFMVQEE